MQTSNSSDTTVLTNRCAIYTRKSTDENLDSDFSSLDAQRESCENYIKSQAAVGWIVLPQRYDDGAYSGGNLERPALKQLFDDVMAGHVDTIVIYKLDRISRSLMDFAKIIELLENQNVSLVAVTQQFNTTTSMGRLTLNILLSFSQFEREIAADRIRDKIGASKKRGMWMGGNPPFGYDVDYEAKKLVPNPEEAVLVRYIFRRYLALHSYVALAKELNSQGHTTKDWITKKGKHHVGRPWDKGNVYRLVKNAVYVGLVSYKNKTYPGEHEPIIENSLWSDVQALRAKDQICSKTGAPSRQSTALLSSILTCGHCDSPMGLTYTKKKNRTYRYYLCQRANKRGYDTCPVKSVPAGTIEKSIIDQLRCVFRSPEILAQTLSVVQKREAEERDSLLSTQETLTRELTTVKAQAARLLDMVAHNDSSFARDELADLDTRRADLETQFRDTTVSLQFLGARISTQADVADELYTLDNIWDNLFPGERQRIVRLLVEKVRVFPDHMDVMLHPEGLYSIVGEMNGGEAKG
jgi:site-specific DNA recombinase